MSYANPPESFFGFAGSVGVQCEETFHDVFCDVSLALHLNIVDIRITQDIHLN